MIVRFEDLSRYRRQVVMVDGGFDPLHPGHVEYFRAAAGLGHPLLCCVAGDRYVRSKHEPLLPEDQRAAVIDAIRYVAYTYVNPGRTVDALLELRPIAYAKGKDWEGRLPPEEVEVCRALDIRVVFLDTVRDSSTRILERYLKRCMPGRES
jgi:cytidyltransferase-like protein